MKTIKYRPHRGTLYDSLLEVREFQNEDELKHFVLEDWHRVYPKEHPLDFDLDDIVISEPVMENDPRIGWKNVCYVCINRMGKENYVEKYGAPQCIGWCGE